MTRRAGIDLNTGERFNPAKGLGEAAFQQMVMNTARTWGWRVWHFHDSRRQRGGKLVGDRDARDFPDLVMVHEGTGVLAFAELKTDSGPVRPGQEEALTLLALAAGDVIQDWDVFLWRPRDWHGIERYLQRGGEWPPGEAPTQWFFIESKVRKGATK